MTTKTCTKCGEIKSTDQFHKCRSHRDGLQSICKTCNAAMSRAYREANRDRTNSYSRTYREANRDKVSARQREYKKAHREELAAYNRAYREANRDNIADRERAYYALVGHPHTERAQQITARYATRTGEPWTPEEDKYILTDPGTIMDKALQLSRTHSAVTVRARRLRQEQTA